MLIHYTYKRKKKKKTIDKIIKIVYNLMANYETAVCATLVAYFLEKYSSGRRGAPAKGVGRVTGAEVQIFSSPPKNDRFRPVVFLYNAKAMVYHHDTVVDIITEGVYHQP